MFPVPLPAVGQEPQEQGGRLAVVLGLCSHGQEQLHLPSSLHLERALSLIHSTSI